METIQDRVEETLAQAGHWRTARAYVVYREQHARLRDAARNWVDVGQCMDEYLEQRDWRVNANANQGYSPGRADPQCGRQGHRQLLAGHVYPREAANAHRAGDIHIHDLDMLSGYCAGWSLRQLLTEGFNGVPGKVEATRHGICPPRLARSSIFGRAAKRMGRRAGVQLCLTPIWRRLSAWMP